MSESNKLYRVNTVQRNKYFLPADTAASAGARFVMGLRERNEFWSAECLMEQSTYTSVSKYASLAMNGMLVAVCHCWLSLIVSSVIIYTINNLFVSFFCESKITFFL